MAVGAFRIALKESKWVVKIYWIVSRIRIPVPTPPISRIARREIVGHIGVRRQEPPLDAGVVPVPRVIEIGGVIAVVGGKRYGAIL